MLNQIVIAGRLTSNPAIKELEDGKKVAMITVAVPRAYKNQDGVYETDFIDCQLWGGIADNTVEYCKKGDIVGVKGRLQTNDVANDDGEIIGKTTNVIAEKLSFLSSSKSEDQE